MNLRGAVRLQPDPTSQSVALDTECFVWPRMKPPGVVTAIICFVLASAFCATIDSPLTHNVTSGELDNWPITAIFDSSEMKACQRYRTPNLVQTASGAVHLIVRCCGANLCSSKTARRRAGQQWHEGRVNRLGDNIKDCRVLFLVTLRILIYLRRDTGVRLQ